MMRRRDLLGLGLAALPLLARTRARGASVAGGRRRPRYYLQIHLNGGIDPILTTDPKAPRDVADGVDVPYRPAEIVRAGGLRFGPAWAPLRPHASRMTVVNGVQMRTANHQSGNSQFARLKTNTSDRMPVALELIGAAREEQALSMVYVGAFFPGLYPAWNGLADAVFFRRDRPPITLLDELHGLPPEEAKMLLEAVRRGAADASRAGLGGGAVSLEDVARLLEALARTPPFRAEEWSKDPEAQVAAERLQRVLWLFEHDLACGALVAPCAQHFDSHAENLAMQTLYGRRTFVPLARFFTELMRRRNRHGALFDNTVVVMGSELGRHPVLNGSNGKDHFPEAPIVLMGAGLNGDSLGQAFGRTGRHMEALKVSRRTGREDGADPGEIALDDVGATLLRIAGLDPIRHGYAGRVLPFLEGVS